MKKLSRTKIKHKIVSILLKHSRSYLMILEYKKKKQLNSLKELNIAYLKAIFLCCVLKMSKSTSLTLNVSAILFLKNLTKRHEGWLFIYNICHRSYGTASGISKVLFVQELVICLMPRQKVKKKVIQLYRILTTPKISWYLIKFWLENVKT